MASPNYGARDRGERQQAPAKARDTDRHQQESAYALAQRRRLVHGLVSVPAAPIETIEETGKRVVLQLDFVNVGTGDLEVLFVVDGTTNVLRAYVPIANPESRTGAILYSDGTSWVYLPAGSVGDVLTINGSGVPEWAAP